MLVRNNLENGLESVVIENDLIRAVFLPSIGGKMIRLINKETGTQYLLAPKNDEGKYFTPSYEDDYLNNYAYGFDDCFPTITSTRNYKNIPGCGFPDHGELWSRPWDYKFIDNRIVFNISGVAKQYSVDKVISISGNRLIINYV